MQSGMPTIRFVLTKVVKNEIHPASMHDSFCSGGLQRCHLHPNSDRHFHRTPQPNPGPAAHVHIHPVGLANTFRSAILRKHQPAQPAQRTGNTKQHCDHSGAKYLWPGHRPQCRFVLGIYLNGKICWLGLCQIPDDHGRYQQSASQH